MDLQDRLIALIERSGMTPTELERQTAIDRMRWSNVKRRSIRAGGDHIEAAAALWPSFAYWLVTGKTLPEAGQISPELEEVREKLERAG